MGNSTHTHTHTHTFHHTVANKNGMNNACEVVTHDGRPDVLCPCFVTNWHCDLGLRGNREIDLGVLGPLLHCPKMFLGDVSVNGVRNIWRDPRRKTTECWRFIRINVIIWKPNPREDDASGLLWKGFFALHQERKSHSTLCSMQVSVCPGATL